MKRTGLWIAVLAIVSIGALAAVLAMGGFIPLQTEDGQIQGGSVVTMSSTDGHVTLKAEPYAGYEFKSWTDGSKEIVRTVETSAQSQIKPVFVRCYDIILSCDPSKGEVSGAGRYQEGERITIEATPSNGSTFHSWSDGSREQRRTIYVGSDMILSANFQKECSVMIDTVGNGRAIGAGVYPEGMVVKLSASPAGETPFQGWFVNGELKTRALEFNITVTEDLHIVCKFEQSVSVTASESSSVMGSVEGGGIVAKGQAVTMTATPKDGYRFVRWVDGYGNDVSHQMTLTVQAENDTHYVAVFGVMDCTVTVNNLDPGYGWSEGGGVARYGDRLTLRAHAYDGYQFGGWFVNGSLVSMEPTYVLEVKGDTVVSSRFNIVHDASFTLSRTDMMVGDDLWLTPKHNIGIRYQYWTVINNDGGAENMNYSYGDNGTVRYLFTLPGIYTITRNVTYEDGMSFSHQEQILVDQVKQLVYEWEYPFAHIETHSILWGLISWKSDEFDQRTIGYAINVRYSDYIDYKNRIEPKEVYFISDKDDYGEGLSRKDSLSVMVTYNDPLIQHIAQDFLEITKYLSDLEKAQFLLNFVTVAVDYCDDDVTTGVHDYWRFPYETLYESKGDCEDSSILFAALAKAMGFDVLVVELPGHVMAAIKVSSALEDNYYEYDGERYYACETTSDSDYYVDIGYMIHGYIGEKARLYKV